MAISGERIFNDWADNMPSADTKAPVEAFGRSKADFGVSKLSLDGFAALDARPASFYQNSPEAVALRQAMQPDKAYDAQFAAVVDGVKSPMANYWGKPTDPTAAKPVAPEGSVTKVFDLFARLGDSFSGSSPAPFSPVMAASTFGPGSIETGSLSRSFDEKAAPKNTPLNPIEAYAARRKPGVENT